MSPDLSITAPWADGDYRFHVGMKQIRELQDNCGAGPLELLDRIVAGQFRAGDIGEVVRLGLIGGGMDPLAALAKVRSYVDARPLGESRLLAAAILSAALFGPRP